MDANVNKYRQNEQAGVTADSCIIVDKKLPHDSESASSLTLQGRNYESWQHLLRTKKVLHIFVTLVKTHAPPVSYFPVLEFLQHLFDVGLLDEGGQVLEIFGKHMSLYLKQLVALSDPSPLMQGHGR